MQRPVLMSPFEAEALVTVPSISTVPQHVL